MSEGTRYRRLRSRRRATDAWPGTALAALVATAGALLASAPATAADTGGSDDSDIETVTVYALRPTPVTRVAAVVTVIDEDTITQSLANDVKELVRYTPGLAVRNDPFRFGLDTFSVRGLGGNRVRVEIDRVPAAGGFAVGNFSDTGRSFVDLAFIDRIEVLRGPASSLYGSDALGGIVAMTTLQPATLLQTAQGGAGGRLEAGYQSEDQGWHAGGVGATPLGPGELLLGYMRRAGRTLDTAAGVTPDPRDYAADSGMLKYALTSMPGGPLTVSAEGNWTHQDTDVNAFLLLPGTRFVNTTAMHGDDAARRYRVGLDQSIAGAFGFDSLEWRLYWQNTATAQDTFETRRAAPPSTPPLQIDRNFRYDARTAGLESSAVRSLSGKTVAQELVAGLEAAATRITEQRDGVQTNLITGATTKTILGENLPVRDLPITDVTEAGAFLQDEIRLVDTRWTLIPALRLDYYRLHPRTDPTYAEDNPHSAAVGLDDVSFSPKLGLMYRIGESLSAFFQYARGFRAPPPEDVNIGLDLPPPINVRAVPNPDLKSETSDGYELGLRWHRPALAATGSVYYNDYRDFIESKVNLGSDPVTGVVLFQSQNVARARIYGAEFELTAHAGDLTPRLAGWSGRLSAAWSRGEDASRHQPLNSVGPASGVAGLRFDAASGRWGSELMVTVVAAKGAVDRSLANLYATAGYATLDWRCNLNFAHGLRLDAGVFNLTDRAYIEWEDVRGRVIGDPLIPYYTRPGRSASATLHWAF